MSPKALEMFRGYYFRFGSRGEVSEPVHVHVYDQDGTEVMKVWLTRDSVKVASRERALRPATEKVLLEYIQQGRGDILNKWITCFGNAEVYGEAPSRRVSFMNLKCDK